EEKEALERFQYENPKLALAKHLASGLALPAGPAVWALRAPSMAGRIAKTALVGAGYGGAAGTGAGEGDLEDRLGSGARGALMGSLLGGAQIPALAGVSWAGRKAYDAMSPTFARMGAQGNSIIDKLAIRASAQEGARGMPAVGTGITPPPSAGANAAADQVIANQLARAGVSADDLEAALATAERNSLFNGGGARGNKGASYAQNVLAPADLDPSLQRLAGSAARASPEAGNVAAGFIQSRQTGQPPTRGFLPETAGLPTRDAFGRMAGGDVPAGQGNRLLDALKRALTIRDEDFHGHGATAYRTEQDILARAKQEANALYGAAYKAGEGVDIRKAIQPIMQKWADAASGEPGPVGKTVQKAIKLFTDTRGQIVPDLRRFDKSKQYLDGVIDKMFNSPKANRYMGGVLTQFKNDMLAAVDALPKLGDKYQAARSAFSSHMEMRDALKLGRDAFRENSEIGADVFGALTQGQLKMARLGLLSGFADRAKSMKLGADKTQIFDNPRIQEILRAAIPKTETATGRAKVVDGQLASFADRPERFGRYVGNEQRMIETRNQVVGNSKTAERLKDDEAFDSMNGLASTLEKFRSSGSAINLGLKAVEHVFDKLFGMRADTAAAISRKLFTADPREQAVLISNLRQRMGRNRFEHFTLLMEQYQRALTPTGTAAAGSASAQ
ncbi:MAG: hypothetical protein AB7F74_30275, partial [Parvibaculaceae bacterium]